MFRIIHTLFVIFPVLVQAIDIPDGFGTNGTFTVGCWFKIDDPPGYPNEYVLLSRSERVPGGRVQFSLRLFEDRPEIVFTSASGLRLGLRHQGDDWMGFHQRVPARTLPKVPHGRWCHVAAVVGDAGKQALYLDGKLWLAGRAYPEAPTVVNVPVQIGEDVMPSGVVFGRFPGLVERVTLDARPLTADEIAARVARERPNLDPRRVRTIGRPPAACETKLLRTTLYEQNLPAALPGSPNRKFTVATLAGVPRIHVDGVPQAAIAMMPSPYVDPTTAALSVRDFAAAGVAFYSDIFWTRGKLNDWWLGEGRYDFGKLDARVMAELAAAPHGFFFPCIKLDPPDWWAAAHPEEMQSQHVKPASGAWADLWPRMLRDVVAHMETAPYAGRVMGYKFGALVGSEWIVRAGPEPACPAFDGRDFAPNQACVRPILDWRKTRGETITPIVLKAARIIKEVTHRRKLTGIFFGYGIPEHAGIAEILASPDIDWLSSPTTYEGRFAGEPGRFGFNLQASCRLHNKIYWDESDLRTHLYHRPSIWRHRDAFESENALKRAFGWNWVHGGETWWFCLEGNGMFHSEGMMDVIARGTARSHETLVTQPAPKGDVAVFTRSAQYIPRGLAQVLARMKFERYELPTAGVSWDAYELADITATNVPAYRVYVFPNATDLTPEERAAALRWTRRPGVTTIWCGLPGYYRGMGEDSAGLTEMTGIAFGEHVFERVENASVTVQGEIRARLAVPRGGRARLDGFGLVQSELQ